MQTVILDGAEIVSEADVHRVFAEALAFPDWYGNNFDALFDTLTVPRTAATVILRRTVLMETMLGRRYRTLLRVLRNAAGENPGLNILQEDGDN